MKHEYKNADTVNMERKTFEETDNLINEVSSQLAKKVLALQDNGFHLLTLTKKDGLYVPDVINVKLEIDVLSILLYQKQYGLQKTKALLKPWVANILALKPDIEALGFIRDDFGRCFLFGFQTTTNTVVNKISILKTGNNISLFVPARANVK